MIAVFWDLWPCSLIERTIVKAGLAASILQVEEENYTFQQIN
jgi:hypothetical protein